MDEELPGACGEDQINPESARILFERQRFLLEDQIHLAETNRNARRTSSTLLVILVGLGVFKIEKFSAISGNTGIQWLLTIAVVCFLLGAFYLFTERSPWWSAWRALKRLQMKRTPIQSGLALNSLNMSIDEIDAQSAMPPESLLVLQTKEFADTYERLKGANYRVRGRLTRGIILLLVGITLAFAAFVTYIWTAEDSNERDRTTRASATAAVCERSGRANVAQALRAGPSDGEPDRCDSRPVGENDPASGSSPPGEDGGRGQANQAGDSDAD